MKRRNINRGYAKLRVWEDAKQLYQLTWEVFRAFPNELKTLVWQQIRSVDSVHRNIAEGYCRKSLAEYIRFLNIALASLGESVSAMEVYRFSGQITENDFEGWDQLAFKIENGLIKLIESLEKKRIEGDWKDQYSVGDPEFYYGPENESGE
jgi:four helix bundle protein